MRKNNKKGFTLAELLIVVAIIAVLVAIAIPVFSRQLESAREGTDAANIRSKYAEFMTDVLMSNNQAIALGHDVTLKQKTSGWQNTDVKAGLEALQNSETSAGNTSVVFSGGIENVGSGKIVQFSYAPAGATTNPVVTIAFPAS